MKGNRALLIAVVIVVVLAAGWWLFRRSAPASTLRLIDGFDQAKKPGRARHSMLIHCSPRVSELTSGCINSVTNRGESRPIYSCGRGLFVTAGCCRARR